VTLEHKPTCNTTDVRSRIDILLKRGDLKSST